MGWLRTMVYGREHEQIAAILALKSIQVCNAALASGIKTDAEAVNAFLDGMGPILDDLRLQGLPPEKFATIMKSYEKHLRAGGLSKATAASSASLLFRAYVGLATELECVTSDQAVADKVRTMGGRVVAPTVAPAVQPPLKVPDRQAKVVCVQLAAKVFGAEIAGDVKTELDIARVASEFGSKMITNVARELDIPLERPSINRVALLVGSFPVVSAVCQVLQTEDFEVAMASVHLSLTPLRPGSEADMEGQAEKSAKEHIAMGELYNAFAAHTQHGEYIDAIGAATLAFIRSNRTPAGYASVRDSIERWRNRFPQSTARPTSA